MSASETMAIGFDSVVLFAFDITSLFPDGSVAHAAAPMAKHTSTRILFMSNSLAGVFCKALDASIPRRQSSQDCTTRMSLADDMSDLSSGVKLHDRMQFMKQMTPAAVERAMKLQDVMLRAMAKRITWYQAAEILGISCRQMLRWQTRFKHEGYEGLFDRRRGVPSPKRVPLETVERVLKLYQEQYFDFNVRHFHEKLATEHGIKLSYTWVKQALQGAGLVKPRRHRGKHRKRRPRRPLPGMLLHIDGSQHRWFCDDRWYDLLVVMDDATSEVYYAQLVEEESTGTVMAGLRSVIEQQGVFCALYSDRASHFFLTPKAGEPVDHHRLTQVGRALRELGIQMIPAYSPQARGRSERGFSTWQGRLPPELRARQIRTLED